MLSRTYELIVILKYKKFIIKEYFLIFFSKIQHLKLFLIMII